MVSIGIVVRELDEKLQFQEDVSYLRSNCYFVETLLEQNNKYVWFHEVVNITDDVMFREQKLTAMFNDYMWICSYRCVL